MPENRDDLAAQAHWVRRLARDCNDEELKAALREAVADLERRLRDGAA